MCYMFLFFCLQCFYKTVRNSKSLLKKISGPFLNIFHRMEDSSETVCLQLRKGKKIYVANVTSNAIAEIMMLGDKSRVMEFLQKGVHESIVVGKFKKQVEIMDVSPLSNTAGNCNNNNDTVETMEIEVSVLYISSLKT